MLCLSFINFVIRKLRQIKTQPGGIINFIESVIWHCPVSCISIKNPLQQRLTVIFLRFGCVFPKCTTFLTGWRPKFSPNSRKWAFSQASTTLAIWRNGTPETHKRCQKKNSNFMLWIFWKIILEKTFTALNPHLEQSGHYSLSFLLGSSSSCPICAAWFFLYLLRKNKNKFLR